MKMFGLEDLEFCDNCNENVELTKDLKVQACPKCGQPMLPCNVCNHKEGCKSGCPFKSEYATKSILWTRENNKK